MIRVHTKSVSLTLLGLVCIVAAPLVPALTPSLLKSPGPLNWITGEWTLAYEKQFDHDLAIRDFAIASWAAASYLVFREGRDGVLVGDNDWLFTAEDYRYPHDALIEQGAKLRAIASVDATLAERGIQLIVAIVPDKSRIYPEFLGRYAQPDYVDARYRSVLDQLESDGVEAVDLSRALSDAKTGGQVFLRTDTHWTPFGADAAAAAIAALPSWAGLAAEKKQFHTSLGPVVEHKGDLLNYVPLGVLQFLGPKPDEIQTQQTSAEDVGGLGLFDEVSVPVTLVGSSYSANGLWNFAGALSQHLGLDVTNAAQEGKGPFLPMQDYLASHEFADTPPNVVIWEIPERFIWVHYDMTLGSS